MDEKKRYQLHAAVFGALAHPVRHELFHLLCEGHTSPSDLAELAGVSRSNVSQHLAILHREGLVRRDRYQGKVRWQPVDRRFVQACDLIDEVMGRELKNQLNALEGEAPHVQEE
jgi:ArsR family transcriptional regulator